MTDHTYIFTTWNGPAPCIQIEVTVAYTVEWNDDVHAPTGGPPSGLVDWFSVVDVDCNAIPEAERLRWTHFLGDRIVKDHIDYMIEQAASEAGERHAEHLDRHDEAKAERAGADQ